VPDDAKRDTEAEAPEVTGAEERAEGAADAGEQAAAGDALADAQAAGQPAQADQAAQFEKLPTIEVEGELIEEGAAPEGASEEGASEEGASEEGASEEGAPEEGAPEAEPAEGEPAGELERDVEVELQAAQVEAERHLDDLRRLKADFENYRKRMLREQTAMAATASQALVAKLLPVLDHFELALSSAEQSRDFEKMLKGIEMVFSELREVLRGEGLEPIEAEGKPFDPQRHEAVISVEDEQAEAGTVVGVVRAGYELQGRVIRPAMVKVAQ
jgi:molecular chaperone GrpE